MSALDDLRSEVAAVRSAEEAAAALITGIAQQLKDALANSGGNGISDADASQIIADLEAGRTELASAVTANTPAAPASTPTDGAQDPNAGQ